MWPRDTKWANVIGKMVVIDLPDPGLPQTFVCKKCTTWEVQQSKWQWNEVCLCAVSTHSTSQVTGVLKPCSVFTAHIHRGLHGSFLAISDFEVLLFWTWIVGMLYSKCEIYTWNLFTCFIAYSPWQEYKLLEARNPILFTLHFQCLERGLTQKWRCVYVLFHFLSLPTQYIHPCLYVVMLFQS